MNEKLSATLEDYVEAIYRLERDKRTARVRDISELVGVAKSTVNAALKSLASKELVEYEPYELIVLTKKGRRTAIDIVTNHEILQHFLHDVLMLEPEKAEETACKMEHSVDREIIERFACFLAYVRKNIGVAGSWIDDFREAIRNGNDDGTCRDCTKDCMSKYGVDITYEWEKS
jgi:DtxR family transcriptional regulator, Mn-dependent transcriptional regulator